MVNRINIRAKMATNVYGLAANLLHPVYRGKQLTSGQKELVHDFFLEVLDERGLTSLCAFKKIESVFLTLSEKHVVEPTTFWSLVEVGHPELANLAMKLLYIPSSSAQLERVFSNWSWIHSSKRNKLTAERSKKLIQAYYSLKIRDECVTDDF